MRRPTEIVIERREDKRPMHAEKIKDTSGAWTGEVHVCYTADDVGRVAKDDEWFLFRCPNCRQPVLGEVGFGCDCGTVVLVSYLGNRYGTDS